MSLEEVLRLVAASVCAVLATARLTRLITMDSWPPSAWLRDAFARLTRDGPWSDGIGCPWCVAPYVAAGILAWGVFSGLHVTWWAFTAWMALSYLAAKVVVSDSN